MVTGTHDVLPDEGEVEEETPYPFSFFTKCCLRILAIMGLALVLCFVLRMYQVLLECSPCP